MRTRTRARVTRLAPSRTSSGNKSILSFTWLFPYSPNVTVRKRRYSYMHYENRYFQCEFREKKFHPSTVQISSHINHVFTLWGRSCFSFFLAPSLFYVFDLFFPFIIVHIYSPGMATRIIRESSHWSIYHTLFPVTSGIREIQSCIILFWRSESVSATYGRIHSYFSTEMVIFIF